MRFVAFHSKLWSFGLLAFVGMFAAIIGRFWQEMPLVPQILFVLLVGLAVVAIIAQLASGRPRLQIDEDGVACYRPFYGTICWEDILSAERAPRVEKQTFRGRTQYRMSFCEAWRPIDLTVRGLDRYSAVLPAGVHRLLSMSMRNNTDPQVFRLRLEMTGMTGSSAEALAVIEHYLAQHRADLPDASDPPLPANQRLCR